MHDNGKSEIEKKSSKNQIRAVFVHMHYICPRDCLTIFWLRFMLVILSLVTTRKD